MPEVIIEGIFGVNNDNEAKLISDLHSERIKISSNTANWYILDLTKTVGNFDASDYENDTYDFLYNEEIIKVVWQGRFYMPAVSLPCNYIVPEFEENLGLLGISEINDKIEIEVNLNDVITLSQNLKYAEKFKIINLTNKKYYLSENNVKLIIKNENNEIEFEFNNFKEFYNYFLNNNDIFFVKKFFSKNIPLNRIEFQEIELIPNVSYEIEIMDKDFENLSTQIIPKLGDIIKTHKNRFYEITEVYPQSIRLWNYIALKIVATRKALTNISLTDEEYKNYLLNFKENKF